MSLSTHMLPVVEEIATEVRDPYEGRLVADGRPSDLTDHIETNSESTLEDVSLEVTTEGAHVADDSTPE